MEKLEIFGGFQAEKWLLRLLTVQKGKKNMAWGPWYGLGVLSLQYLWVYRFTLPHMYALRVKFRPWSQISKPPTKQNQKWMVQILYPFRFGIYKVCRLQKCDHLGVGTPDLKPILPQVS